MNAKPSGGRVSVRWMLISTALAAGLAALLIWGFIQGRGEATAEAERELPVKAAAGVSRDSRGGATIALSPELQRQAYIETAKPRAAPYQRLVEAYGSILDMQAFTELSNTISNTKSQQAISEARFAATQAAFQRARNLHKGEALSTAQLEAAEAAFRADGASLASAKVQAQNAAASAYQAWGPVLGRSLVEETALAKDLVERKKVLAQVTLPIGVPLEKAPRTASIETTAGERIGTEFVSAATRTDPKIQGVSFFYTANAESGALPGMNVIAFLPVGQTPGILIPASAVVWLQGRAWVYLQTAPNTFTRREIPTSEPQPGGGYAVPAQTALPAPEPEASAPKPDPEGQALPVNEPIVIEGAQVLLSQEFSAQIDVSGD
jgi:hypothetical protein